MADSYKSEMFVPIKKDERTFNERQKNIWDTIQDDLDRDFMRKGGRGVGGLMDMATGRNSPGGSRTVFDSGMDESCSYNTMFICIDMTPIHFY